MKARIPPIRAPRTQRLIIAAIALAVVVVASVAILHDTRSFAAAPATHPIPFSTLPNFADLVENVQPTVVNISAISNQTGRFLSAVPWQEQPFGPWFRRFFDDHGSSLNRSPNQPVTGVGSGFIVDPAGFIVTNYHVVNRAERITVTLNDGQQHPAKLVGGDEKTDLALVKIDVESPLRHAEFGDSDSTRPGDWVVAIGNPFGLGGTVTAGILSARGRDIRTGPYDDYLQIDAPINQGNSGGPLFDLSGRVIGVNTAIISPNGGSFGIGFAIPTEFAQPIIEDLRDYGRIERGWLGVQIQSLTDDIAQSLGLTSTTGALVAGVAPRGPAEKAGILVGDIILSLAGVKIEDARALSRAIAKTHPQASISLELWRGGDHKTVRVDIGEKPADTSLVAETPVVSSKARIGVSLSRLTSSLRDRFELADSLTGVVIVGVEADSPAERKTLRVGDVIVRVGDTEVEIPADVARGVQLAAESDPKMVLLLVERRGNAFFVALPLV